MTNPDIKINIDMRTLDRLREIKGVPRNLAKLIANCELEVTAQAIRNGECTLNDARAAHGLGPVPGGGELMIARESNVAKPDLYLQQREQRFTLSVFTGPYEGLTISLPTDVGESKLREVIQNAMRNFCPSGATAAYDPWMCSTSIPKDLLDQMSPLSPRNASA